MQAEGRLVLPMIGETVAHMFLCLEPPQSLHSSLFRRFQALVLAWAEFLRALSCSAAVAEH